MLVAPEVIEQSGATTASDIWYANNLGIRVCVTELRVAGASVAS